MHAHMRANAHAHARCTYACTHACTCTCACTCVCVCVHMFTNTCTYACTCTSILGPKTPGTRCVLDLLGAVKYDYTYKALTLIAEGWVYDPYVNFTLTLRLCQCCLHFCSYCIMSGLTDFSSNIYRVVGPLNV